MLSVDDFVMCLDDSNRHIAGYDGAHGGHDVAQRKLEEKILLVSSG